MITMAQRIRFLPPCVPDDVGKDGIEWDNERVSFKDIHRRVKALQKLLAAEAREQDKENWKRWKEIKKAIASDKRAQARADAEAAQAAKRAAEAEADAKELETYLAGLVAREAVRFEAIKAAQRQAKKDANECRRLERQIANDTRRLHAGIFRIWAGKHNGPLVAKATPLNGSPAIAKSR